MVNHYSQHQSHREGLLSQVAGPTPGLSDADEWGLWVCSSNEMPGAANPAGPWAVL